MATAMEMGARLQAMADEVVRSVNGKKSDVAAKLADALQAVRGMSEAATEPTSEVAMMLGEDHPGTTAIVGNSANVQEACEAIEAAINSVIQQLELSSSSIDQLGFTYESVGTDIASGRH